MDHAWCPRCQAGARRQQPGWQPLSTVGVPASATGEPVAPVPSAGAARALTPAPVAGPSTSSTSSTPTLARRLAGFVALTKPRIVELLLVTTLPTMIVAARGFPGAGLVAATLVGGALAAGGANAMNMFVDRDIDAVMRRTARRPLVTGVVSPAAALGFAVALEVAAFALLWAEVNPPAAVLAVGATLFYVFVYTVWLKRSSVQNIVIGGAAGAVPVLVGWVAVRGSLGLAPLVLFALVFVWTPPHFWALAFRYRDDYRAAGVPMLPVVAPLAKVTRQIVLYSVLVVVASLGFGWSAHLGPIYWTVAAASGAVFVAYALALCRDPTEARAMRLFHWSITYVTVLFTAMAVDQLVHL